MPDARLERTRRNYIEVRCSRCFGSGAIPSETCDMGCVDCQDTCPVCKGSGRLDGNGKPLARDPNNVWRF